MPDGAECENRTGEHHADRHGIDGPFRPQANDETEQQACRKIGERQQHPPVFVRLRHRQRHEHPAESDAERNEAQSGA